MAIVVLERAVIPRQWNVHGSEEMHMHTPPRAKVPSIPLLLLLVVLVLLFASSVCLAHASRTETSLPCQERSFSFVFFLRL